MANIEVERRVPGALYGRTATELTGPLQPTRDRVEYRHAYARRAEWTLRGLGVLHVAAAVALAVFLLLPGHLPALDSLHPVAAVFTVIGLAVMVLMQIIVALRTLVLTFFAARARDPIPMVPQPGLRVAVLTTIVPGKEPVDLVMATLRAMRRIRHDGVLDVWLLDEGDDPEVRRRCERLGVRHFSRKGRPEWNQAAGPFKARTKHGNHNAWRSAHETEYDVVAQMDPDHVPYPNFLERTLGYFADPDTAFVVAPQVYANLTESFVARGAAELAYLFHGVIQRGGNGRGAPLLIGTNHLYRPAAFRQIDGYQDSIIEDHLTSMVIFGAVNPATGNAWRGVYTPDVVAVGEGPATYSDFFSQQKRWAYGIWQIARSHSPAVLARLPLMSQRLSFAALQTHYPTTAVSWVGGIFLTGLYLVGGITITRLPSVVWAALFVLNTVVGLAFVQFTRRFNLVDHERRSWGLSGMLLELATAPIYLAAAAAQLAGRPLAYVVTPKGSAATGDTWRTFRPHLGWAGLSAVFIAAGTAMHHSYVSLYVWAALTIVTCLIPILHLTLSRWSRTQPVVARRRVGQVLMEAGLLTEAQLGELLDRQITTDGPWRRLGDLAVEDGYVTAAQLAEVTGSRPVLVTATT
ncbi:glycosyltransferase family 2 protein [Actinoplanes sp. NPDC051861]|uniref:glycosyltransferase family 2 protein n=1 Tax=Actinoplanes sp. NPDC051861 TaxID=3155170 RepID=UPI0034485852